MPILVLLIGFFSQTALSCIHYRQFGWNPVHQASGLVSKAAGVTMTAEDLAAFIENMAARKLAMVQLPPEALPKIPESKDGGRARYGHSNRTLHWTELGKLGGPGAILIQGQPERVGPFEYPQFNVPPHAHKDAHVSLILEGEGYFFIQRPEGVAYVPVKPGSLVVIPAGAGHTFWAGKAGVKVLSLTGSMVEPTSDDFATKFSFDGNPAKLMGPEEVAVP